MSEKNEKLIPFGKYANQPVEVLQNDPQYVQWLTSQPWFQDRYPAIFNVVINKFGEDEETPEHNRLQAKFLDEGFRMKMFGKLLEKKNPEISSDLVMEKWNEFFEQFKNCERLLEALLNIEKYLEETKKSNLSFFSEESRKYEKQREDVKRTESLFRRNMDGIRRNYGWAFPHIEQKTSVIVGLPYFEMKAVDCEFYGESIFGNYELKIEIKPEITDSYPAVLRQMRNNGSNILIFENFNSRGVDEKTMISFFETQKIDVFRFSDVENFDFSIFKIK
jgi:hypothetical protein